MAKEIKETKETKVTSAKVCAILHSITTVLWLFNAGIVLTSSISSGNKLGWNFWSDIAIAVVFPISVKVVILVAGMCVGIGFLLCEEAGDKKDTKPLDEKSKS